MPFPNFVGKHAHDAFFTPQESIALRQQKVPRDFTPPTGVVVCYQSSLLQHILAVEAVERVDIGLGEAYLLPRTGSQVAVIGGFGIGAPAAAIVVEHLIAFGVREVVNIGTAGALQRALRIGDIVVCTSAIRDEGLSHHYLPSAPYAHPSAALTTRLQDALTAAGRSWTAGPSWTIDAAYRETVAEARHYQREGVLTVEMEAAAIFAVAEYRQVAAAAAFVISDSLADQVWDPKFSAPSVQHGLVHLYGAAVDALADLKP